MSYPIALIRWLRLIGLLTFETLTARYQRSGWPILLAVLEPMGLVFILSGFAFYMSGGVLPPPFGNSFIVFYATGLVPVYALIQVAAKTRLMDQPRLFPFTSRFDYLVACITGDVCIRFFVLGVFVLLWGSFSRNLLGCLAPLAILGTLGACFGIIIMVATTFWPSAAYLAPFIVRVLMHASCIYFVMDRAPPKLRDLASYNPMSHAITWLRYEYYSGFPIKSLNLGYLFEFTAGMVILTILLEGSTRQWRRVH